MAGTVSFPNIGSSIDVQSIIDAYVSAQTVAQNQMQQRVKSLQSASTTISSISSNLSKLSSALSALTDANDVQTFAVTSSGKEVAATVTGAAQSGTYSVEVIDPAKEYRAYSATKATSATDSAYISGVLRIAVGSAEGKDITIDPGDSLNAIVGKINSSGLRIAASTFYDGSNYRLQLRGLDSGAANQVSLAGLDLGFSDTGNAVQQASDAHLTVDGIDVYSASNQVSGAIPGVTLAVVAKTTSPLTINVAENPQGLADKVQAMVTAYNAVVSQVHTTAGYAQTTAAIPSLAGDSTLRSLTDSLSRTILNTVTTSGNYSTLGSLGISLQRDGSLSLDSTKLTKAVTGDPQSVVSVLAGSGSNKGVMDLLADVAKSFDQAGSGILANKVETINRQVSSWNNNIDREQARIDNYTNMLRAQFTAMTASITSSKSMGDYLTAILENKSSSG